MKTRYKHIHFEQRPDKTWRCRNNKSGAVLAEIYFYDPWRVYVSDGFGRRVFFDAGCHRDMADFLDQLGKEDEDGTIQGMNDA